MTDGIPLLMTAIIPTRGLGTFRAGDRRERYPGAGDVAGKGEGEDEAITLRTVERRHRARASTSTLPIPMGHRRCIMRHRSA